MSNIPLGYHITFGTYGTRLHGDPRGTVCRDRNRPGEPIIGMNTDWQRVERAALKHEPVYLTEPQRRLVESVIPSICVRGGWRYVVAAAQPDHVHVLLSTEIEGKRVRRWLKAWLTQAMNGVWSEPGSASPVREHGSRLGSRIGWPPREAWWSECGSVKWVWDRAYHARVEGYVARQRCSTGPR